MWDYQFDPQRLRTAHRQISDRWPLKAEGLPTGLSALFDLLAQLQFEALETWCTRLSRRDLALLCRYANLCENSRALLVLTLILSWLNDDRNRVVLRLFMHRNPPLEELAQLRSVWSQFKLSEAAAGVPWVFAYFRGEHRESVVDFVKDALLDGRIDVSDVEESVVTVTPLFTALTEFFFTEGRTLLRRISPIIAASYARRFFQQGQDDRVAAFLNAFPENEWPVPFIEEVVARWGEPADRNPAYRVLEPGKIWGVRKVAFMARMVKVDMKPMHWDFWTLHLHQCETWLFRDGCVHAVIPPLRFVEGRRETEVFLLEQGDRVVERFWCDDQWGLKMEALLREYQSW